MLKRDRYTTKEIATAFNIAPARLYKFLQEADAPKPTFFAGQYKQIRIYARAEINAWLVVRLAEGTPPRPPKKLDFCLPPEPIYTYLPAIMPSKPEQACFQPSALKRTDIPPKEKKPADFHWRHGEYMPSKR